MINSKIVLGTEHLIYFLVVLVLTLLVFFLLSYLRKQTSQKITELLYVERNYILYQELLKNKRLRWIYRRVTIELYKLYGYLEEGNDKEALEVINKIEHMKLNRYEHIEFIMKKFSFFISTQDKKRSKQALEQFEAKLDKSKNKVLLDQLNEAKLIYSIYMDKDVSLIETLKEKVEEQTNNIIKGVTYFRIAKLYYFKKELNKVKDYLTIASPLVKGTYYEPIIEEALQNPKILEIK